MTNTPRQGPLTGTRIVEMTGIGPVPYATMLMADMGAQVIRIDRRGGYPAPDPDLDFGALDAAAIFYRSRPVVEVNLKTDAGRALVHRLIAQSDALIEGYRPGAMERLGLGPQDALRLKPALTYTRVTGWGQTGPRAQTAGHDLNYIALSGALSLFARDGTPPQGLPPLIGDMAGGALFAVIGTLASILNARATGQGQVVDANMVDGTASLYTLIQALAAAGMHRWPGGNVLDGGRWYYRTYACAEGHVAVGAIEPAFRKILIDTLGVSDNPRLDTDPEALLSEVFATKPATHWDALFRETDGCVTMIRTPDQAANYTDSFTTIDGIPRPIPHPGSTPHPARSPRLRHRRSTPTRMPCWTGA